MNDIKSFDWFKEKIGLTIYGTSGCSCSACQVQYLKGVKIADLNHIESLMIIQESTARRYFATKEERVEYEKTLKG